MLLLGVCFGIASCGDDEKKDSWRETNDKWFQEQINRKEDGRNYYKMVTAPWDNRGQVLIHWFNDTMLTKASSSTSRDWDFRCTLCPRFPPCSSRLA